jgi:serine/threonine-protein kinase
VDPTVERLNAALAGRYRVERELGRGGMATVYRAHDVRHDRDVALKVLEPQVAAFLGTDRFLQEIRVTARLRHPHILPLFDSGDVGGTLFYVMPLVEGESLRARTNREPKLTIEEAVRFTREVAGALGHAHAQGVIHRDIKPENILLENGHALVADFGIARAIASSRGTRMTQAGIALGTPDYMSPEQAAGDETDGRSDIYSLACVLFEMLAGAPPFTGGTPEAVLVQRFTRSAPRLSSRRSDVSTGLDHAITRALAREPQQRFDTMGRFADALTSAASGPAGTGGQSIAVLPFTNMSPDPDYFGDGIADEIINALTQVPGLKVAARTSSFSFKGKNEDLRVVGEKLGVTTVLEGSVRRAGSRVRVTAQLIEAATGYHLWSERFDRELTDIFAIQDDIATGIVSQLRVALGSPLPELERVRQFWETRYARLDATLQQLVKPRTSNVEAYELYLKGRAAVRHRGSELAGAVTAFEQAVRLDPYFASAHAELAQALSLLTFWGALPADQVRKRALTAAGHAMTLGADLPESHTATALTALLLEYDRERASTAWDRALALDPLNPDTRILRALFDLSYIRGDHDAAIREVGAAIEQDPESGYAFTSHSIALSFAGRFEAALVSARRAVELDPDSLYAHWSLLLALALLGRIDEVLAAAPGSLGRFGRHPWLLTAVSIAAATSGRTDTAEAVYAELRGRAALEPVQLTMLAAAAANARHQDEAFACLHEAVKQREALLPAVVLGWPGLAPLRSAPEFTTVIAAMGWSRTD